MWKSKYELNESASNFHNTVRQILIEDPYWKSIKAYQEVPIKDLVENFRRALYVDWYIKPFNVCIELHGVQHYRPVDFGNEGRDRALVNLKRTQTRDSEKKYALLEAGYGYVEIPYSLEKELNGKVLKDLVLGADNEDL